MAMVWHLGLGIVWRSGRLGHCVGKGQIMCFTEDTLMKFVVSYNC